MLSFIVVMALISGGINISTTCVNKSKYGKVKIRK